MSPVGAFGPGCVNGKACHPGRPARAAHTHGFCSQCWRAMSPRTRKVERDCDPSEPVTPSVGPLSSAAKHAAFERYYEARQTTDETAP